MTETTSPSQWMPWAATTPPRSCSTACAAGACRRRGTDRHACAAPPTVVEPVSRAQHARCVARPGSRRGHRHGRASGAGRAQEEGLAPSWWAAAWSRRAQAQGFFSAGSTGACLAAATLVMGRIKGVSRPCAGHGRAQSPVRPMRAVPMWAPTPIASPSTWCSSPRWPRVYAEKIVGYETPSAPRCSTSARRTRRATRFAQDAHASSWPSARDQLRRQRRRGATSSARSFDVVVTDGFTGNVCLKTIEGASKALFRRHQGTAMMSHATKGKIGAAVRQGRPEGPCKTSVVARHLRRRSASRREGRLHRRARIARARWPLKNGVLTTARVARQRRF